MMEMNICLNIHEKNETVRCKLETSLKNSYMLFKVQYFQL